MKGYKRLNLKKKILVRYDLSYNAFSFKVFTHFRESRYYRHFFINKNYGGCPRDLGWLAVKDSANFRGACGWDKHNSYPQFLYGRNGKVTRWNDMSMIFFV